MLPILRFAGDQNEHTFSEAIERVCEFLHLAPEDRAVTLPSGTQTQVYNRFCWAVTYLQKAGLLLKPGRGRFRISELGSAALEENPSSITSEFLARYQSLRDFRTQSRSGSQGPQPEEQIANTTSTPKERLERAHEELAESLALELLEKCKACSPRFFEHLVVGLLVQMGYGGSRADAAQVVGRTGDGGIDGTIKEDKLGLDTIYIQAKRWDGSIGRKEIQAFAGSLEGERASKGVFITTSSFTSEAIDYAGRIGKKIVLIDGVRLTRLMIEYGVGCGEEQVYRTKKLDNDCFEEE